MSLGLAVCVGLGVIGYALVGLHVAFDVATHNRGMLPAQRLSPLLRGVFWFPYAVVGFGLTVGDVLRQR